MATQPAILGARQGKKPVAPETAITLVPQPDSMLTIIERAVMSPDFDVLKLAQLLEVRERWEKNEARKAFVSAVNKFKASPPEISKNKTVSFGQGDRATHYKHATLDHVCDAVTKGLSEHGISHRWKVDQDASGIKVTCILTHELGHAEETTLIGAPDNSGSKNSIQSIGSTVTYLQRYTLLAATGLAAADSDNDGRAPVSSNGDLSERVAAIADAGDAEVLKLIYNNAYRQFKTNPAALQVLIAAKDKRKADLCR